MTAVHRRLRPRRRPPIAALERRQRKGQHQGRGAIQLHLRGVEQRQRFALTFFRQRRQLQPDQDFSRSVHLVDKKSGKVDGAWELAPNLKEVQGDQRRVDRDNQLALWLQVTQTQLFEVRRQLPGAKMAPGSWRRTSKSCVCVTWSQSAS
jgi:hypothetical protein